MIDGISIGMFNDMNYAAHISSNRKEEEILNEDTIYLEHYKSNKVTLEEALDRRHSVRYFDGNYTIPFSVFSSVIQRSFGISQKRTYIFDDIKTPCRNYGSGGGLYPIDVFILCKRCEKIKNGFYKYQAYSNSLLPLFTNDDFDNLINGENFDFDSINFGIFYGYSLSRNYIKYGELGIMAGIVEVGLMSQNFELVVTSYGLNTCQIAGINKNIIESKIGYDGLKNHILMVNICGKENR